MSATHMGWTFEHSPYRGATLAVHLALADSANDMHGHELWASQSWIAGKSRTSRSTVNEALAQLVADGFLEVLEDNRLSGRPNRYRFLFPEVDKSWRARREGVPRDDTPVSGEPTPGVVPDDTPVSPETTGGVPRDDTNPIEPNGEPNQEPDDDEIAASAAFNEFWERWTPVAGRGKGPKKAARERFAKLGPQLRQRMLATTRGYLAMCEAEERATVDCSTWLGDGTKSWRAWEGEVDAPDADEPRASFRSLPPSEWTETERAMLTRQVAERPPDMWEPAALRLLIHLRPEGAEVRNALGMLTFPPADATPGADATDEELLAWWDAERAA